MLKTYRNQQEIQWGVFFRSWGISYKYVGDEIHSERCLRPSFWLEEPGVWVALRPQDEQTQAQELLQQYARFVVYSRQTLLVLFGRPQVKIPNAQGWGLQLINNELVATPTHLTECPSCGGFCASGIGTTDMQMKRPGHYRQIAVQATTPSLLKAYEKSSNSPFWIH
jgi:hypothetical protein